MSRTQRLIPDLYSILFRSHANQIEIVVDRRTRSRKGLDLKTTRRGRAAGLEPNLRISFNGDHACRTRGKGRADEAHRHVSS